MALRNILNHCVHRLKPYRQFSSSRLIYKEQYLPSLPVLSTPWLMFPYRSGGLFGPYDIYLNIIDNTHVKVRRPTHWSIPLTRNCVGSAKGWVAFDCDSDGSLFLANPYTNEASSRKLPAPSVFPTFKVGLHFTLAGDPMSNNFSVIQDKRGMFNKLCLAAYNRKANTLYKLHFEDSGKLQLVIRSYPLEDDETGDKTRVLSLFVDPEVVKKYKFEDSWEHTVEKYLAVTEENDPSLYLVIRHVANEKKVGCKTKHIELYKIDLEAGGKMECVESIGYKALFLETNSEPFFISTRNCLGLKSNCVYVADDLGFYELEKKSITPFDSQWERYDDDYYSSEDEDDFCYRPQCFWVAPPSIA